ncbi:hypothetical protein NDA13_000191 [Ustilago tritici]|nr:hypothetical protein NDA13_000191 [Ustilago tritici]
MTTTTDDSLNAAVQLFFQHTAPTPPPLRLLQGEEEDLVHWSWYTAGGHGCIQPALITTPSLKYSSNDQTDMPSYSSAGIPMDLSGSKQYNHSTHGCGLPPILDLMDPTIPTGTIASTSGASIAGTGGDDIFTMPSPLQA